MKANDESEVCDGPHCNTRVEQEWTYCPSCGRKQQPIFWDRSGQRFDTSRKDLSIQALAAAAGATILGISLVVGLMLQVLVGWTGLLAYVGEFLVFPLGFVFGVLFGLVGFSLWLKYEGYKYGSYQP
jgi:hypothetical protein